MEDLSTNWSYTIWNDTETKFEAPLNNAGAADWPLGIVVIDVKDISIDTNDLLL